MALSTPSVTKVNGDPSLAHSGGTLWVTIKQGDPGGWPPQALAISKVLRPHTPAPYVPIASLRISALCDETLSTMLPSEIGTSVSPLMYHVKSRSPPSPKPFSGPSFGPATKPSSDTVMLKTTFPMGCSFTSLFPEVRRGARSCPLRRPPCRTAPYHPGPPPSGRRTGPSCGCARPAALRI